jgi:hypothetical protein
MPSTRYKENFLGILEFNHEWTPIDTNVLRGERTTDNADYTDFARSALECGDLAPLLGANHESTRINTKKFKNEPIIGFSQNLDRCRVRGL